MEDSVNVIKLFTKTQVVAIVPRLGGGIAEWRAYRRGEWFDVLRPTPDAAIRSGNTLALSCFPLLPYSNRIRHGRFRFGGRDIKLPLNFGDHPHSIHGHGWQAVWRVRARSDRHLRMRYDHTADAWPFAYSTEQIVELDDSGPRFSLRLTNRGSEPMPAGLGLHPYFAGASETRLRADVHQVWLTDAEVMPTDLVDLPARWHLPSGRAIAGLDCDNLFTGWCGTARIDWPAHSVSVRAAPPLDKLVVYAPPGADFFCVEPVSHVTDAFNLANQGHTDTGIRVLSPDQSLTAEIHFELAIS